MVVHEVNIAEGTFLETENDSPMWTDSKQSISGPRANAKWLGTHHHTHIGGLVGGVEKLQGPAYAAEILLG
jgi:hypothetical protein